MLENLLALPTIWYPGQDQEEADLDLHQMVERAVATQQMLDGQLEFDSYCDLLSDQGYYVSELLSDWEQGHSHL
jgi:hypothetical protein